MNKKLTKILYVGAIISILISSSAFAGKESGGGDIYVQDFDFYATQAYKWLENNGKEISPVVNADIFLQTLLNAIEQNEIQSTNDPKTWVGVPKDAIYTDSNGVTLIIRPRWNLDTPDLKSSQATPKVRFAAHEIFRRMGLDDNAYQLSNQLVGSLFSSDITHLFNAGKYTTSIDYDGDAYFDGSCSRELELNASENELVLALGLQKFKCDINVSDQTTLVNHGLVYYEYEIPGGSTFVGRCSAQNDGPQCAFDFPESFSEDGAGNTIYKYHSREIWTPLPDGNIAVELHGIVDTVLLSGSTYPYTETVIKSSDSLLISFKMFFQGPNKYPNN